METPNCPISAGAVQNRTLVRIDFEEDQSIELLICERLQRDCDVYLPPRPFMRNKTRSDRIDARTRPTTTSTARIRSAIGRLSEGLLVPQTTGVQCLEDLAQSEMVKPNSNARANVAEPHFDPLVLQLINPIDLLVFQLINPSRHNDAQV